MPRPIFDLTQATSKINKGNLQTEPNEVKSIMIQAMMMTIPKFKKVWDKTKDIHSTEF
jgi:hypothetical protein